MDTTTHSKQCSGNDDDTHRGKDLRPPDDTRCAPKTFQEQRLVRIPADLRGAQDCCAGESCGTATAQPSLSTDGCCSTSKTRTVPSTDDCCSGKEHEIVALSKHGSIRRVLQIVLVINLVMFFAEFGAGVVAKSTALMADSIDMLGDATVYMLSLYALGRGARWRAGAALAKGAIILAFGLWIAIEVVVKLSYGVTPAADTMGAFGVLALVANVICLALLWQFRNVDINMSSTFECSRNDIVANLGVLLAAGGVWLTGAGWPDIAVGTLVAVLFFRSALRVIKQAWPQFRDNRLAT